MSKIKMVATDIDGTILKHNGEFNPKVLECLKNLDKLGVKVVLVTGRMNRSAKKIADIIGINSPVVSFQGALVCENNHTTNSKSTDINKKPSDNFSQSLVAWFLFFVDDQQRSF